MGRAIVANGVAEKKGPQPDLLAVLDLSAQR